MERGAAEEAVAEALASRGYLATTPRAWDPSEPTSAPNDLAHVRALFEAQAPGYEVLAVHRVENEPLARVYEAVRSSMSCEEEHMLWHGTSTESVQNIVCHGFNRAYSGRHGTKLGHGTYFSQQAGYSARFCGSDVRLRRGGRGAMLLSKVLVGECAKGAPELVEPPYKDAAGLQRYDSVVDDVERPSMYCVFRDFQALPLYFVEFEARNAQREPPRAN